MAPFIDQEFLQLSLLRSGKDDPFYGRYKTGGFDPGQYGFLTYKFFDRDAFLCQPYLRETYLKNLPRHLINMPLYPVLNAAKC